MGDLKVETGFLLLTVVSAFLAAAFLAGLADLTMILSSLSASPSPSSVSSSPSSALSSLVSAVSFAVLAFLGVGVPLSWSALRFLV